MRTFGLMPTRDFATMEFLLNFVCKEFPEGVINTLELGVHKGDTSRGIHGQLEQAGRINFHTAIDNQHDLPIQCPFDGCNLIIGSSIQVFDQIKDDSQHFIFCDANHSLFFTTSDFLLYRNKVRIGGFFLFHDTSPHIKPFKDYQYIGERDNPHNYISCRKAAENLGLINGSFPGWGMILDEFDPLAETGGILALKRLK